LVRRLDTHFVSLISASGLARIEAERLFVKERIRLNQEVAMKRAQVLRIEILRGYGLKIHESDLMAAAKAFGKR
jgi:hypothetical protein